MASALPSTGNAACAECHYDVSDLHDRGPHRTLLCEKCHGPLEQHFLEDGQSAAVPRFENVTRLCSRCHREIIARRGEAPQLNLEAHVVEMGALFSDRVCFDCHLPHDPRP